MKKVSFKKIDAFATEKSRGNPAGMVFLDSHITATADEMQKIARELKGFVSEVGYVRQIDEKTFDLKYYSSERQVDFCGHATIAILYDLIKNSPALLEQNQLTIQTLKGNLLVENRVKAEDAVFITAPAPVFSSNPIHMESLTSALQTAPDNIHPSHPVSVVNAGLETLIVPLRNLPAMLDLSPDINILKDFCLTNAIDIITVFTCDVADQKNFYRTRVFAPAFGYLEDPATGSGNAALGAYLLKNRLWDGSMTAIKQNGSLENPNIVKLMAKKTENGDPRVMFGGGAVTRMEGAYFLW